MNGLIRTIKNSFLLSVMLLTACGGDGLGGGAGVQVFTVGGSVTGLTGDLTLANSAGDSITITADGNYVFPAAYSNASPYNIAITAQPAGQSCSISNGSGAVSGASVDNVDINCSAPASGDLNYTYTISYSSDCTSADVSYTATGGDTSGNYAWYTAATNQTPDYNSPITYGTSLSLSYVTAGNYTVGLSQSGVTVADTIVIDFVSCQNGSGSGTSPSLAFAQIADLDTVHAGEFNYVSDVAYIKVAGNKIVINFDVRDYKPDGSIVLHNELWAYDPATGFNLVHVFQNEESGVITNKEFDVSANYIIWDNKISPSSSNVIERYDLSTQTTTIVANGDWHLPLITDGFFTISSGTGSVTQVYDTNTLSLINTYDPMTPVEVTGEYLYYATNNFVERLHEPTSVTGTVVVDNADGLYPENLTFGFYTSRGSAGDNFAWVAMSDVYLNNTSTGVNQIGTGIQGYTWDFDSYVFNSANNHLENRSLQLSVSPDLVLYQKAHTLSDIRERTGRIMKYNIADTTETEIAANIDGMVKEICAINNNVYYYGENDYRALGGMSTYDANYEGGIYKNNNSSESMIHQFSYAEKIDVDHEMFFSESHVFILRDYAVYSAPLN